MTNKEKLQAHNAELQELIGVAEALPDAKGEIKLQSKNVLPTKEIQRVTAGDGYDGLSEVTVKAIPDAYITPSGSVTITENGEYDVKNLETAVVNVEGSGGETVDVIAGITQKTITEAVSDGVKTIPDNFFRDCGKLAYVWLPNCESIGAYAFNGTLITEAVFPKAKTLSNRAFSSCGLLKNASFPSATSLGNEAFNNCFSIETAFFPEVTKIQTWVFYSNWKLPLIDLPKVNSIGAGAFYDCRILEAIILRAETMATLSNVSAFTSTPIASGTGYIYVPASLVDSYKAATNWSTYAAQIRAIEDYPDITGG